MFILTEQSNMKHKPEIGQASVEVTSLPGTVLEEGFDYLILSSEGDVSLEDYRDSVAAVFFGSSSAWLGNRPSRR